MIEIDDQPPEEKISTLPNTDGPDGRGTKPPRLTKKMTFLLVLTFIAIVVIVILALISPVAGGDISIVLSL